MKVKPEHSEFSKQTNKKRSENKQHVCERGENAIGIVHHEKWYRHLLQKRCSIVSFTMPVGGTMQFLVASVFSWILSFPIILFCISRLAKLVCSSDDPDQLICQFRIICTCVSFECIDHC